MSQETSARRTTVIDYQTRENHKPCSLQRPQDQDLLESNTDVFLKACCHSLLFVIVDVDVTPLLGFLSCLSMGIVKLRPGVHQVTMENVQSSFDKFSHSSTMYLVINTENSPAYTQWKWTLMYSLWPDHPTASLLRCSAEYQLYLDGCKIMAS